MIDIKAFPAISQFKLPESKRLCFICLKDINPIAIKIEGENETVTTPQTQYVNDSHNLKFPLRHISRFLKFSGMDMQRSAKSVVETCEACSKITDEFTVLYKDWDEIQLRMNWCLRKMCVVMRTADKEKFSSVDRNDDSTFARLRKATILNGTKRIREGLLPTVSVKRVQLHKNKIYSDSGQNDVASSPPPSEPDGSAIFIGETKAERSHYDDDTTVSSPHDDHLQEVHSGADPELQISGIGDNGDMDHSPQPPAEIGSPSIPTPDTSLATMTNDDVSCPFCRAVIRCNNIHPSKQQSRLSAHILQYHCEHHFPNQKLDTVTPSQYQRILVDLLFKDICVKHMNHYSCPWCDKSLRSASAPSVSNDLVRFKLHLLSSHRDNLEMRLTLIQRDPQLSKKLENANPKGVSCECGVYLVNAHSYRRHEQLHCTAKVPNDQLIGRTTKRNVVGRQQEGKETETLLPTVSPPKRMRLSWQESGHAKAVELGTRRELNRPAINNLAESSEPMLPSNSNSHRSNTQVQLHLLQPVLRGPRNKQYHNFLPGAPNHEGMQQKQCNSTIEFPRNGRKPYRTTTTPPYSASPPTISDVQAPSSILKQDNSRSHPTPSTSSHQENLSCLYCRATFLTEPGSISTPRNHFMSHMFQYHCKHFFPQQKLDKIADSQYQQILADLLFRDISFEKNQFKCSWCPVSFTSENVQYRALHFAQLKLHMVDIHMKELEQRLQLLQQDPWLSQKLKTINPSGVICECGIYLSSKSLETAHRRNHCPAKTSKTLPMPSWELELRENASRSGGDSGCSKNTNSVLCSYCRKRVNSSDNGKGLRKHYVKYHLDHFFQNSRKEEFVSKKEFQKMLEESLFKDFIKSNSKVCKLCDDMYIGRGSISKRTIVLRDHYLEKHHAALKNKLDDLQSDFIRQKDFNPNSCTKTLAPRKRIGKRRQNNAAANLLKRSRKIVQRTRREKLGLKTLICPYCKVKLAALPTGFKGNGLRLHLVRFHVEHYFPNERKEDLVTASQFKRIVADLLFKDLVFRNDNECGLCGKMYGSNRSHPYSGSQRFVNLKDHYLTKHRDILKERLESIQNDTKLAEKLVRCNPNGGECCCGTYLRTRRARLSHEQHCRSARVVTIPTCVVSPTSNTPSAPVATPVPVTTTTSIHSPGIFTTSEPINTPEPSTTPAPIATSVPITSPPSIASPEPTAAPTPTMAPVPIRAPANITAPAYNVAPAANMAPAPYMTPSANRTAAPFSDRVHTLAPAASIASATYMTAAPHNNPPPTTTREPIMTPSSTMATVPDMTPGPFGTRFHNYAHVPSMAPPPAMAQAPAMAPAPQQHFMNPVPSMVKVPYLAGAPNMTRRHFMVSAPTNTSTKTSTAINTECVPPLSQDVVIPANGNHQSEISGKIYSYVKEKVCPYCMANHANSHALKMHLMSFHMDHFFPNVRNAALVSPEQFKKIVGDLLFTNFIKENETSCRLCGKMFHSSEFPQRSAYLKEHLIAEHYGTLKEKLDCLQQDPNLPWMLYRTNPNAVICSCGAYLRNDRSQKIHQHYTNCKIIKDTPGASTNHPTNNVKVEPEQQWNCDRCGFIFFFKEMLEDHKRNDCMQASSSISNVSHSPDQSIQFRQLEPQAVNINNMQQLNWGNANHEFMNYYGYSSGIAQRVGDPRGLHNLAQFHFLSQPRQ